MMNRKLHLLSWNVRGLNDPDKRVIVKDVVRQWEVSIICLEETKVEIMSDIFVKSVGI